MASRRTRGLQVITALAVLASASLLWPRVVADGATVEGQGMRAVTTSDTYVAWHIHVPVQGLVGVSEFVNLDDGEGSGDWFISATPDQGRGGSSSYDPPHAGVAAHRIAVHAGTDAGLEGSDSSLVNPDDYDVVAILGGGTAPVGVMTVSVQAPPGTIVLGTAHGKAMDLTDADFAPRDAVVVDTPVGGHKVVHGTRAITAHGSLWGEFMTDSQDAQISYTDPSGVVHTDPWGYMWFGAPSGTYSLRLDEDEKATVGPNQ